MTKTIISIQAWRFCPVCMVRTCHVKTESGWVCNHTDMASGNPAPRQSPLGVDLPDMRRASADCGRADVLGMRVQ